MATPSIAELEARLAAASVEPIDTAKRVDAMTELAWQLRDVDVHRANALAEQARDLAREHGYTLGEARATRTMAMSINDVEGLGTVFQLGEEAKRLFDEAGDDLGRAASRDFLASVHEHIGELAVGLELALDALSIAQKIGDPIRQGYALSNVGGILAASGEADIGVERLKEALELFEEANDALGVGAICTRLSNIFKEQGKLDDALTYAKKCREAAEATRTEYLACSSLATMADLEHLRGHPKEAESLYRAALASLKNKSSQEVMGAEAQVALGKLLLEQGELDAAERELRTALSHTQHAVSIVNAAAAHNAFAELCERQGKLAETIEHLRAAQELRERIAQQDANTKLRQMEARAAIETARKDAEIHRLRFVELHGMQSKLVEAEKMALLGRLAAGTAHELHTPLGVLRSNAKLAGSATRRLLSLVRDDAELGARASKLASVLESGQASNEEALERIAAIAHSLGRFTELDQAERRSFDVRDGVDSALTLLEPTLPEGVTLERHFGEVPHIEAWPRELNHAFLTVLQNAAEAITGEGVVSAETTATPQHVLVRVRDTGRGMSEEEVAHLFDVAWSEGDERIKMRLGLSAAYATMEKHGGSIEVQSALGEGTVITFRFPLAGPDPSAG